MLTRGKVYQVHSLIYQFKQERMIAKERYQESSEDSEKKVAREIRRQE